jgi:tetratricopeptide (TPR) repeat protein
MFIRKVFFQLILWFLAAWRGLAHKEVAARSGRTLGQITQLLSRDRKRPLDEADYQQLLAAMRARTAHGAVTAAWLESLEALDLDNGLTPEERDIVELWLLGDTQVRRQAVYELVLRSGQTPPLDEYPKPEHVAPARWRASLQLAILRGLAEPERLAVVRSIRKFQTWALAEAVADESTRNASKNIKTADAWARLAVEVAELVQGPESWQKRVRGYVAACGPNVRRVEGKLEEAEAGLAAANELWLAGSDPDGILDPGRLLDLEASLHRDLRRFDEALDRLTRARQVSRHPGKVLVKRGFTLQVMGEYEQAIETLLEAEPLVEIERQNDPQLWYKLQANLAVCWLRVGRYQEAAEVEELVRPEAVRLGDEHEVIRLTWLRGCIAAGQGHARKARSLLVSALQGFRERKLWCDMALAFLELAALLLREGKRAEVKALTPILADVFQSKKLYPEALTALRYFRDAAERDAADEELARRVLNFLFRALYDPGLRFES